MDSRNFPVYIKFLDQKISCSIIKESAWHKIAAKVKSGQALIYWDNKELRGRPFIVDKI